MKDLTIKNVTLESMDKMDKEQMLKLMAEFKEDAKAKCLDYNEALLEQDGTVIELNDSIMDKVGKYNYLAKKVCIIECAEAENPMIEAIKRLTVQTIRVKDVKEGELKTPIRSIVDTTQEIDLYKLHSYVKGGIGYDKTWIEKIEKLNLLMTLCVASDLKLSADRIKELDCSYSMRELSRDKEIKGTLVKDGKVAAPSKREWLKALTDMTQSMMGEEYKPTSHDVAYLLACHTAKGKDPRVVKVASHKQLRSILLNICNNVLLQGGYDINARLKK